MASFGDKRKHVRFVDSRGSLLAETLLKVGVKKSEFEIKASPGAKIQWLIRQADEYAKKYPFDVIYIAGGINNVTTKCKITKVVTFDRLSEKALSDFHINTLEGALKYLKRQHPATKFIFCSIP